jgi:hypothetical protein
MAVWVHMLGFLGALVVFAFFFYILGQTGAMFKRVEGGFVFRWRAHHYLLTEAQKAEIQRLMRGTLTFVMRRSQQKRIGQVLEAARHTEQKITWRDQR